MKRHKSLTIYQKVASIGCLDKPQVSRVLKFMI